MVPENIHTIATLKIRASKCNVFFFFSKFQSGDDNEELTQDLNGNQNYENGDIEMDAGFEGEYCQQLILLSDTFMYQLITRLLISILQSLDPFIFFKTGSVFLCTCTSSALRKLEFQYVLWASSSHVLLAWDNCWLNVFGRFRFFRIGRLDHCWTSQLATEIGFFQRVLLKNHLLHAYYLGFD